MHLLKALGGQRRCAPLARMMRWVEIEWEVIFPSYRRSRTKVGTKRCLISIFPSMHPSGLWRWGDVGPLGGILAFIIQLDHDPQGQPVRDLE